MAFNSLNRPKMWHITIRAKQNFSNKDRDFLAELISEEARKTCKPYSFILHEVIESQKYCKIFIEGTKKAFLNLLVVIHDNFFRAKDISFN